MSPAGSKAAKSWSGLQPHSHRILLPEVFIINCDGFDVLAWRQVAGRCAGGSRNILKLEVAVHKREGHLPSVHLLFLGIRERLQFAEVHSGRFRSMPVHTAEARLGLDRAEQMTGQGGWQGRTGQAVSQRALCDCQRYMLAVPCACANLLAHALAHVGAEARRHFSILVFFQPVKEGRAREGCIHRADDQVALQVFQRPAKTAGRRYVESKSAATQQCWQQLAAGTHLLRSTLFSTRSRPLEWYAGLKNWKHFFTQEAG